MNPLSMGLDVGSTTLKLMELGEEHSGFAPRYIRHRGDLLGAARSAFDGLDDGLQVRLFVTGSGGALLADPWGVPHVHEVSACTAAVQSWHKEASSVIELGGQDAKLIAWNNGCRPQVAMNDRCAAGTGVTIDRCLERLGISPARAAQVAYDPERAHTVSTKCGVFAETDLVNLARSGVGVEDLVVSLVRAVVFQNLGLLTRGIELGKNIVLLGGPHMFLPALAGAWRYELGGRSVVVPDQGLHYPALGACLLGETRFPRAPVQAIRDLREHLTCIPSAVDARRVDRPFGSIEFKKRPTMSQRQPVSIGIDAGSTSTQAVAIDAAGEAIGLAECASRDPVGDARQLLGDLKHQFPDASVDTLPLGVTGYGAPMLAGVLQADIELVETVAQVRAAQHLDPEVDVVCDVGGQDIKIICLSPSGGVRDFWLSSQCSAGLGVLLEAVSSDFQVELESYAAHVAGAHRVPYFEDECVVFLDSSRVTFQRDGYQPAEILAGLARALPRIVFSQVTNGIPVHTLGRRFVLQGGVHRNAAVVQAQIDYLKANIQDVQVRAHPRPELTGAIGAALLAVETPRIGRPDRSLFLQAPVRMRRDKQTECRICPSRCARTFIEVSGAGTFVSGHGCEEGASTEVQASAVLGAARRRKHEIPNLIAEENRLRFGAVETERLHSPSAPIRIGIPRALGMYRCAPFFRSYLEALGAEVRFSTETTSDLWERGGRHGASDPCFPVKVLAAHVHQLLDEEHRLYQPLDAIFTPYFTHGATPFERLSDTASCTAVMAAPALVRSAFADELTQRNVALVDPVITIVRGPLLRRQMYDAFGKFLGVRREASDAAVTLGLATMASVRSRLVSRGQEILNGLTAKRWQSAVLLLARPYHTDPGLNHRIGEEIQAMGLPALSIACLPHDGAHHAEIDDLIPGCANSGAAERVWAARFAARHNRMAVLDLSSFKCGQDSPTYGPIQDILSGSGVVHCALHELDETRPVTSLRIRLRTFAHALRERGMLG